MTIEVGKDKDQSWPRMASAIADLRGSGRKAAGAPLGGSSPYLAAIE